MTRRARYRTGGPRDREEVAPALVWSTCSPATRRVARFETAAVGAFALVSGLLSLLCHALFETPVRLDARDLALIAVLGLGPLGGAFFLWDAAIKRGDPRRIGLLAFLTPLLSTIEARRAGQNIAAK